MIATSTNLFAGIDVGTTSVKMIVVNEIGSVVYRSSRELTLSTPKPGWYEQNPEEWWKATAELLQELMEKNIEPEALGLTGQMHSLVLLEKNGEVLRPAILWNDQRTAKECVEITNLLGGESEVIKRLGNPVLPGFTAPKILWVKKNEPDVFKKAFTFLLPKDYIAYKLTGSLRTEPSDASGTSLFSVKENRWDEDVLQSLFGNQLVPPEIVPSHGVVGNIRPEIARELGIKNIEVVAGGADNACAALGMGAMKEQQMVVSVGTSGTVIVTGKDYKPDTTARIHLFRHVISDLYYHMGVVLSATFSLDWAIKILYQNANHNNIEKILAGAAYLPPIPDGVFFLPYLSGERSPHRDPDARGVIFGLSGKVSKNAIIRSVMEGVAFALRDCKEAIEDLSALPSIARITGGGSKSDLWVKIIASVMNTTMERMEKNEGASLGAAMLAGIAHGCDVSKWNSLSDTFIPNDQWTDHYEKGFGCYKRLYQQLRELMKETRYFEHS
ncbi:MAG: xylulokinase [Thermotogota bacterium]|nr:xylulokinase [Thermotogota bacterium]MDK2865586.1 xylulokinase [Thermotogota bacterium]HCZ05876.1 xylulokinase [Thermotogota bacterium]